MGATNPLPAFEPEESVLDQIYQARFDRTDRVLAHLETALQAVREIPEDPRTADLYDGAAEAAEHLRAALALLRPPRDS